MNNLSSENANALYVYTDRVLDLIGKRGQDLKAIGLDALECDIIKSALTEYKRLLWEGKVAITDAEADEMFNDCLNEK